MLFLKNVFFFVLKLLKKTGLKMNLSALFFVCVYLAVPNIHHNKRSQIFARFDNF